MTDFPTLAGWVARDDFDWPLSAPATAVLRKLTRKAPPMALPYRVVEIAICELILRRQLTVRSLQPQPDGPDQLLVSATAAPDRAPLPPPLAYVAACVPAGDEVELSASLREAGAGRPLQFGEAARAAAVQELRAHGLAEDRTKRVLLLIPQTFPVPTQPGQPWVEAAEHRATQVERLPEIAPWGAERGITLEAEVLKQGALAALTAPTFQAAAAANGIGLAGDPEAVTEAIRQIALACASGPGGDSGGWGAAADAAASAG